MNKLHVILLGLGAGLLLVGCASTGDDPYEDEHVVQALGLEEERLDRPGLFDELFARRAEPRDDAREQRLQQLEAALQQHQGERALDRTPVLDGQPRHRVGLLIDAQADPRLDERLAAAAPDFPIRLARAMATLDAMEELDCSRPMDCAVDLRTYPGLRLILDIRGEDDPRFLSLQLHDLELEVSSEQRRIALPDGPDGRVPQPALDSLADLLLLEATDQAMRLPWFARSFAADDDGWLINAGRSAGVREDDLFQVQRPGRAMHGPAGNVIGWVPGEAVGTVRVVRVAGEDVALVAPVDGQAPGARDILVPMD